MRYKPNNWPMIPMFLEILMNSKRIPDDYDISHLTAIGAGAEACNNTQIQRVQAFLAKHNSKLNFTTGYGSSEAGSNLTFHVSKRGAGNCNMGCPMPLTTVTICKPGTTQELPYGENGEICVSGPGIMVGYDTKEATDKALKIHEDGKIWLHMGDMGRMDEEGHVYVLGRGANNKRYGGGYVDILPMENLLADANIAGLEDEFFVNIPDADHEGYLEPHLYVVLQDGICVEQVKEQIHAALKPHMIPVRITQLPERPFWHFKTNRIGLTNEVLRARAACC
jgi:acyl-CoA synthetase (AMP-forming)/AMP-acid ligase II